MRLSLLLILATVLAAPAAAQTPEPRPADVASPEAIIEAAYAAIAREPNQSPDWDRFRSLFLPGARLVPNVEQTQGEFRVMTPEDFIVWANGLWDIEDPDDPGFVEEQVAITVERYGDIAHAFSTYQSRFYGSEEVLGLGINSFQLVQNGGRWWIAGIVWDDESGAGPIPPRYLGGADEGGATGSDGGDPGPSAAMDAVYERFTRAYRLAEPDSVVALYTDDALYLPAGGDIRRGKETLRGEFGFLDSIRDGGGEALIEFESVDRGASGDLAYDIGHYRLRVERGDGTTTDPSRGKFATVWKRGADGAWRIHVDSFSPAPPE